VLWDSQVKSERVRSIRRLLIDQAGVGSGLLDEAKRSVPNVDGVVLSLSTKQGIMDYPKLVMQERRILTLH